MKKSEGKEVIILRHTNIDGTDAVYIDGKFVGEFRGLPIQEFWALQRVIKNFVDEKNIRIEQTRTKEYTKKFSEKLVIPPPPSLDEMM